jgi:peptidoglycan/xylan/chitin deacetylase (PgdA/CDA1 family)
MHTYPILMYHGIHDSSQDEGIYDPVYSVGVSRFKEHLDWLMEEGYQTVLLREILKNPNLKKSVVITFDDGDRSNFSAALPLLVERKMKAEFFITTNRIDRQPGAVTGEQVRELFAAGMSVQSHSVTHRYLSDLNHEDIYNELLESKLSLERLTNSKVFALSLPGGRGSDEVVKIARDIGYEAICTSKMAHNLYNSNPFNLNRLSVYRDTDIAKFRSIVTGTGMYMKKIIWRQRLLSIPKSILGNVLYGRLHDQIRGMLIKN